MTFSSYMPKNIQLPIYFGDVHVILNLAFFRYVTLVSFKATINDDFEDFR